MSCNHFQNDSYKIKCCNREIRLPVQIYCFTHLVLITQHRQYDKHSSYLRGNTGEQ